MQYIGACEGEGGEGLRLRPESFVLYAHTHENTTHI